MKDHRITITCPKCKAFIDIDIPEHLVTRQNTLEGYAKQFGELECNCPVKNRPKRDIKIERGS